jgi:hypothetical protein
MAKKKVDGVIEAVHYAPGGQQVAWVRLYERRGPTYSDIVIWDRDEVIQQIKAGKKLVAGSRVFFLSSTFELKDPIQVNSLGGKDYLALSDSASARDDLAGLPVI